MTAARQTVTAASAHYMPFAANDLARMKIADVRSGGDNFTHELVPDRHGNGNCGTRPVVPFVNVQVSPADSGVGDSNQNVVNADRRLGYIFERQAGRIPRLHQSFHFCMVIAALCSYWTSAK